MSYVDGFVIPVPDRNKEAYRDMALKAAPIFKEHGAQHFVECWGDDVPDGKITDFRRAVKAEGGENVVFSWVTYPSREVRDEANRKIMADERLNMDGESTPFDMQRMIYGGFAPLLEKRSDGAFGYADGYLVAVPMDNKQAYHDMAAKAATVFEEYGATRVVEAWGDDVPNGKVTDFKSAVNANEDEAVVFSWVEWPSKQVRDEAWPKIMADERMQPDKDSMPFDGKRMIYGGFAPIVDE
ncbi:DUF1428 domain-containing protein [Sphingosinicella rhizophila]|uniref:DUF1428 domain-containing protein n=1 Tax=Sphingosinicella rhizophila TaxID=3050082 RepID=A0ABU3Q6J4_9SPHN|nr:DUF1428 domain-containing protein [Sphingosinicella sp. GR2756]MDT9599026.1 DUF1428 domain-containing protein [Sphingosinicella sp. GR2756]